MRTDQRRVTVTVDGVSLGVFDKKSGGTADSDEVKYRRGGMGPEVVIGGPQMTENVTVAKMIDEESWQQMRGLMQRRGRAPATITDHALDIDGNAVGTPLVTTGILKSVKPPDHDANSGDVAELELEISTASSIG